MKTAYFIIILIFSLTTAAQSPAKSEVKNISMIELLSNPGKHHGHDIRVKGFFIDFKRYGRLYLSKEDAIYGIDENSIFIDYDFVGKSSEEIENFFKLDNNYILIGAIFNENKSGRQSHSIIDIFYFYKLKTLVERIIEQD